MGGVVVDPEIMGAISQFGVAGLVCWMWLTERRGAAERERQIGEAHEALKRQHEEREGLLEVVRDNTRALGAVEAGQRELAWAIERLGAPGCGRAQHPERG